MTLKTLFWVLCNRGYKLKLGDKKPLTETVDKCQSTCKSHKLCVVWGWNFENNECFHRYGVDKQDVELEVSS